MVKLGLVSDSHGRADRLREAARALRDCDEVLHAGDCAEDAARLEAYLDKPVWRVRGNCDGGSTAPRALTLRRGGSLILLCHGDQDNVKFGGLLSLTYRARAAGADIVVYGHTHVPAVDRDGSLLLVNPGALMDGRCAILEFRDNGVCPLLLSLPET